MMMCASIRASGVGSSEESPGAWSPKDAFGASDATLSAFAARGRVRLIPRRKLGFMGSLQHRL
ncbi:hypothetical protein GCM10009754_83270 [Amycolatopsis minnesotensis]|uniref:Uncharacterized protein n=1 Tax=Amycolatopsis minnesotensis TaxID=337894 RepID=A0ABP5E9P1_9PSEU